MPSYISKFRDIDGLRAFLSLDHVEFDFLPLFKRFESLAVDACIVYEYIVAFRITDESTTAPVLIFLFMIFDTPLRAAKICQSLRIF